MTDKRVEESPVYNSVQSSSTAEHAPPYALQRAGERHQRVPPKTDEVPCPRLGSSVELQTHRRPDLVVWHNPCTTIGAMLRFGQECLLSG